MSKQPMDTSVSPFYPKVKSKVVKSERKKLLRDKELQQQIQNSIKVKDGEYILIQSTKKSKCWTQFLEIFKVSRQAQVIVEGYSCCKYCLIVFFHAGTTTGMNRHMITCTPGKFFKNTYFYLLPFFFSFFYLFNCVK